MLIPRTDLVIPSSRASHLRIPSLAVTDGSADPEWVDMPMSRWRFRLRPSLRLPVDAGTAKSVRRYVRLTPWSLLSSLAGLAAVICALTGHLPATAILLTGAVSTLLRGRGLPRQVPYRTAGGDLRIPGVPLRVAQEWVAGNPGVIATDNPAPRRHSRRFYGTWAAGLIVAAVAVADVLAANGRPDPALLWLLVAVSLVAGLTLAYKIEPSTKPR
jgi:hypothetical protein